MAKSLLTDLNFSQNEAQNLVMQNLASAPASPKAGQHYYNTVDNIEYVWNGTAWIDAMNQGEILTFTAPLVKTGTNVTINDSSNTAVGAIRIATDVEAETGTAELIAVNPKQLATKVTANAAITGATHTKITYDSKGLVTSGADITLSDVTDVTATAAEVNVLDGITASTAELNILDGVTATTTEINVLDGITASTTELNYVDGVTSSIQNQLDSKIGLTALSIDSGSTDYLTYDNTSGEFGANVDTTVTASSTNLVTSGAVSTAIANAISGALKYEGTWVATGQTDYSSITLPVKKGYYYIVSGSATIGGIEWNSGDMLIMNKDVAAGGTITSADFDKVDNTESADLVRLNETQTLTNKTIDADDNTISDLTTSNFKSGVIVTTVGSTGSDSSIPTEQAVREAISDKKVVATNPALTASGGICTWTITAANSPDVSCTIRETTGGAEVLCDVTYGSGSITVKINSASNISAGTYTAVVLG